MLKVEGNDNFLFDELNNKELKYKIDFLGEQNKEQTVNKENPTFIIQLKDSSVDIPKIYSTNDINSIITCAKKESTDSYITCYPHETNMPKTTDYRIYYQNSCEEIKETGITIHYTLFLKITVLQIYFSDNTQCTKSPLTQFKLLLDKHPSVGGITAILSNDITFNCISDDTILTCQSSDSIAEGKYSLSSLQGVDLFTLNIPDNYLQYQTDPLSANQIKSPIVKKSSPTFTINLQSPSSFTPKIYVDNNTDNIIQCERSEQTLSCRPDSLNMPSTALYKIFSDGACDTIVDTGITVNNILSKKITITDIYFTTGSKTCTESTIESFTMSINSQPTGDVSTAILKQNSSNIIFSICSYDSSTITCSNPSGNFSEGFYSLYSVTGDDSYLFGELSQLEYHMNPLGEQIEINPVINKNIIFFDIVLSSQTVEAPLIYVGNDSNKKELSCKKNNKILTCYPTQSEMPERKDYSIYYISKCEGIKSTGITVHNIPTSTIKVTNISLYDNSLCSIEPFSSIVITLENIPKGEIREAKLTKIDDNKTEIVF